MPNRMYRHVCAADDRREKLTSRRRCRECGEVAEFAAWHWSVVEQWCRYNRRTGLSPFGPKPPWLEEKQITRVCGRCNGHGLLGAHLYHGYRVCPECDGAGGFPVLDALTRHRVDMYWVEKMRERREELRRRDDAYEREIAALIAPELPEEEARAIVRRMRDGRNSQRTGGWELVWQRLFDFVKRVRTQGARLGTYFWNSWIP